MTFDRIIAVVACIATVICTVIAVLSYLHNKDDEKKNAALFDRHGGALLNWRQPYESVISFLFNIAQHTFTVKSLTY